MHFLFYCRLLTRNYYKKKNILDISKFIPAGGQGAIAITVLKNNSIISSLMKKINNNETEIEVKTERDMWKTTGNIAIEIRCNGKLSGLSVTEAETWIHLLSYNNKIEGGFIFNTGYLKDRIGELHKNKEVKVIMGGDNKLSQMVLVPIEKLKKFAIDLS